MSYKYWAATQAVQPCFVLPLYYFLSLLVLTTGNSVQALWSCPWSSCLDLFLQLQANSGDKPPQALVLSLLSTSASSISLTQASLYLDPMTIHSWDFGHMSPLIHSKVYTQHSGLVGLVMYSWILSILTVYWLGSSKYQESDSFSLLWATSGATHQQGLTTCWKIMV